MANIFPHYLLPPKISTEYHSSILLDYPGPCWRPNGTPQGSVCTVWPGEVRSSWGCEGHPRQIRKPGTGTFGTVCETQGSEGNPSGLTDPWDCSSGLRQTPLRQAHLRKTETGQEARGLLAAFRLPPNTI